MDELQPMTRREELERALSPRHVAYARYYAMGNSKTRAAALADIPASEQNGWNYHNSPGVRELISIYQGIAATETVNQLAVVLQRLADLALADPRDLFNGDGSLKLPDDWPPDIAARVVGITLDKETGLPKSVRLTSPETAIQVILNHLDEANNMEAGRKIVQILTPDALIQTVRDKHHGQSTQVRTDPTDIDIDANHGANDHGASSGEPERVVPITPEFTAVSPEREQRLAIQPDATYRGRNRLLRRVGASTGSPKESQ